MAAGTIACTVCGEGIPVEFTRVSDAVNGHVNLLMGMAPLQAHIRVCDGSPAASSDKAVEKYQPPKSVPDTELTGRIDRMLNAKSPDGGRFFVVQAGSRACTMCGMSGASCMALIGQNTREGCCQLCMDGNTHRAPHDDLACAEWAVVHAPKH